MVGCISVEVDRRVRAAARNRCGYCLGHQDYIQTILEIEHIIPVSTGGSDDEENLWLACRVCNSHKSNKITALDPESGEEVPLFNPRTQDWANHFGWSDNGLYVIGLTPIGRATVIALHLNTDPIALVVRQKWIEANWHPPKD